MELIIRTLTGVGAEILTLFIEMTPYLILGMIFVGILHGFVSKDFIAKNLGKNDIFSIIKAAVLGVPLPLCSCGVIPASVYMKKSGASRSSVVSFLVSTPQTGVDSILATYGMMGPVFAIFRPLAALVMGVVSGITTFLFGGLDATEDKFHSRDEKKNLSFGERVKGMAKYAFVDFIDDIALQFIIGLVLAGLVAYFIPDDFFRGKIYSEGILGMLIMIAFGIPLYICATTSIPVAIALMAKGVSAGAAYVFLVAGPATNAASLAILMKVLGKRTTAVYLTTLAALSIGFGYLLDLTFKLLNIDPVSQLVTHAHSHEGPLLWLKYVAAILFGALMLFALGKKYIYKKFFAKPKEEMEVLSSAHIVSIEGMDCKNCVANIDKALLEVEGVSKVEIFLDEEKAAVYGEFHTTEINTAVESIGYKVRSIAKAFKVDGMTCGHCVANVSDAVKTVEGVTNAEVDLAKGIALIEGDFNDKDVVKAIEEIGYKVETDAREFVVEGMTCGHCVASVTKAIEAVEGVSHVKVSLSEKKATVSGDFKSEDIKKAIEGAGYTAK